MRITKWDRYLYKNYKYITGGIMFGAVLVFFLCTTLSSNRLINVVGAVWMLFSSVSYYLLEKRYKLVARFVYERKKKTLYQKCVESLNVLELLLNQLDYLTKMDKLELLDELWEELSCYCISLQNFESLFKKINHYILYFEERVKEFKHKQSSQRQSFNSNRISTTEHLQILGLSPNTNDFQLIKTRYRQLMKKYHPDLNKSPKALEMAQKINFAYEQLEKIFAH